jgi:hypothetical protein
VLYWVALVAFAFAVAYLVLFGILPATHRSLSGFGSRVEMALNAPRPEHINAMPVEPVPVPQPQLNPVSEAVAQSVRSYSSYDGFKSYAQGGVLSIDDVVKGLARNNKSAAASAPQEDDFAPAAPAATAPKAPAPNFVPAYQNVEPIYNNVDMIEEEAPAAKEETPAPAHIRGFVAALLEGDREAVFAGLRQQVRGGGSPEQLVSNVVVLLDDAYRARVDGTPCDADVVRMTARFSTPTLEKLVASLTNAIDSSYTTNVTGAKLALTRALVVLGA